jgi:hypothetical protein
MTPGGVSWGFWVSLFNAVLVSAAVVTLVWLVW